MKATSVVIPLVALLAVGTWLVSQRRSIARLEQQNAVLQGRLAEERMAPASGKHATPVTSTLDQKPVNWADVARQLRSGEEEGFLQTGLRLKTELMESFNGMSVAELESLLGEIAGAGLSQADLALLESTLASLLGKKDPERGLTKYIDQVHEDPFTFILQAAFRQWVLADPAKAQAWFDREIAAGKFDSRRLNGNLHTRFLFEREITLALLRDSPESAGLRLAAFPEDQRSSVLQGLDTGRTIYTDEALHRPFAEMLRQQLPDDDRLNAISWPLIDLGESDTIGYPAADAYFSRIEATPAEVDACILAVTAEGRFPRKSGHVSGTMPADLVALREWVTRKSPQLVDEATALALRSILNHSGNELPQWAEYASNLHKSGASDEVLIPVIEAHNAADHQKSILNLVRQLSDGERREDYLKEFQ